MSFGLNKKRQSYPQIPSIPRHMYITYMSEILVKECDRFENALCLMSSSSGL